MRDIRVSAAVVYSSPLRRARESAELISPSLVVLPELAEISMGEWEGLTWEQVEAADPETAQRKADDWTAVTPPGGESWTEFMDRVDSGLDKILRGPFPAAIMAHLGVNAWIIHRITGRSPLAFQQMYGQVDQHEL